MKDPAFLFYSGDFYVSTRTMLPEERACYLDLLIYQHQNGYIPDDIDRLALHCSGIAKATLEATLEAKFKRCDKGWYNPRLSAVMAERQEYTEKQSINGTIGQFWKRLKAHVKNKKDYEKIREKFLRIPKEELYVLIEDFKNQSYATFEAMLKAMLKHLEDENEDENIDKQDIEEEKKEGVQGEEKEEKTWREDFEVYKSELTAACESLKSDPRFISKHQKFYPGLNIPLSLEKACVNFWATENGWKHKRQRCRNGDPDWERTFANALSQPQNKVYDNRHSNFTSNEAERRRNSLADLERDAFGFLSAVAGKNRQ